MLRIAIVEDEIKYQEMFRGYVERYSQEKGLDINVSVFEDGLDISENYSGDFDALLLDIKLKHQDGMTAARLIREHDTSVQIMFITTLAQYAIHGYEVGAIDYVLKPVEYEKFSIRFDRLVKNIKPREKEEYMLLPTEDGRDRVPLRNIRYIEVNHHYLDIHTRDDAGESREYSIRKSISKIESELAGENFIRCDHSIIVNLDAVSKINKDTLVVDDKVLPISRSKKKAVLLAVASQNL